MPADHGRGCQVLDDAMFFDSTVDDKKFNPAKYILHYSPDRGALENVEWTRVA
jgi:hypothetical protein